ncbi:MAG: hypothetical protein CAPSK01_001054 [Candidatus Accumulibacter vicinus]|uniref:Uncharacterized protein n=1 Tax=Candidatus Accumulibacter vicinus TaxID=2954382 RepID=A0A084Y3L4_9PROT|nr:MAG: hypothetical protein CAPSK01_001054 [Candidatus Accumulibacter vicinus]
MCNRQAGRSRGVGHDRDQFGGDVGDSGDGFGRSGQSVGEVDARQVETVKSAVAEAEDVRMLAPDLA